jgi:hypothetical protein
VADHGGGVLGADEGVAGGFAGGLKEGAGGGMGAVVGHASVVMARGKRICLHVYMQAWQTGMSAPPTRQGTTDRALI